MADSNGGHTTGKCPFAMLAYQLLVVEKRASIADVAARMGMSYAALHSRLISRARFRPEEIRQLVALVPDPRLVQFFIADSRFVLAERAPAGTPDADSIRAAVARAMREAADVLMVVVNSLEAGLTLSPRDRAAILQEVQQAESAMASLHIAVAGPAVPGLAIE